MNKTTFIFRVDSSLEIGTGHLIRCLALAGYLLECNSEVVFICRDHQGSCHGMIEEQNFNLHLLHGKEKKIISKNPDDWLGYSQLQDAHESSEIISKYPKAHVIVDHYSLDYSWESNIKCDSITVIDDLANRSHKCNLLIDQSLKNTKSDYEDLIDGNFSFVGGNNLILREEFIEANDWQGPGSKKVFLCMGGIDPFNHTELILKSIINSHKNSLDNEKLSEIIVIAGNSYNKNLDENHFINESNLKVKICKSPKRISKFMLQSDLCVLSCGTLILEACALGVPSLGIVLAENQKKTADFLKMTGAIELHDMKNNYNSTIYSSINSLLGNSQELLNFSKKQKQVVSKSSKQTILRNIYER
tara:strand:- start:2502 stop:3581 length:1080 start_codon:yes stop_codon:yes gene_type:complete